MYVKETAWGYGVFRFGRLQMEFETETEAYDYLEYLRSR